MINVYCAFYLQFFSYVLCCICCVRLSYCTKITYLLTYRYHIHSVPPKRPPVMFLNNFVKNEPILTILIRYILKKINMKILQISLPHLSDVATLPWEIPKKSFFQHYYSYSSEYLRYLRRKRIVIHFPIPSENVTTLTCELQNFFI